jgi:hypothetical protein
MEDLCQISRRELNKLLKSNLHPTFNPNCLIPYLLLARPLVLTLDSPLVPYQLQQPFPLLLLLESQLFISRFAHFRPL